MPQDQFMTLGELFNAVGRLIEQQGYTCATNIQSLRITDGGIRKAVAATEFSVTDLEAATEARDELRAELRDAENEIDELEEQLAALERQLREAAAENCERCTKQ